MSDPVEELAAVLGMALSITPNSFPFIVFNSKSGEVHLVVEISDEALEAMARAALVHTQAQRDDLVEALRKIGYAPDGAAGPDLAECISIARAALAKVQG